MGLAKYVDKLHTYYRIGRIKSFLVLGSMILISVLLVVLLPSSGHEADMGYWVRWAMYLKDNEFHTIYTTDANYPPIYLYLLKVYGWLFTTTADILLHKQYLKFIPYIFELGAILFLWFYRKVFKASDFAFLFIYFKSCILL